jgi:hypothetical protein
MSVTNSLNPLVVKTELDAIFVQEYMYPVGPGMATAVTPQIFKQEGIDNSAHIEAILSGGGGLWQVKGEEQPVPQSSPRVANKVTYVAVTWANSLQLSKEFFDDNMHGTYSAMVQKFATAARSTRDQTAFGIYRNAFTTTLTADGVAFIDDAHITITGETVDNQITLNPVLSPTSLNTGIVQLLQQKSQDGIIMGQQPAYLLVPSALYKSALEITGSTLVSDSANNAINVFSSTYQIMVFHSPYLGAAISGGSDTAWFLLSRNHGVTRYIREEVTTSLVDYIYSNNDNYVYKGRFREVFGVSDYVGAVGSTGLGS